MIKARRNYKNSVRKGMKRYALRKKRVPASRLLLMLLVLNVNVMVLLCLLIIVTL